MDASLLRKLDPRHFPNMSLPMAAILGLVLERQFTTPALADVQMTPHGHVLGRPSEEEGVGPQVSVGARFPIMPVRSAKSVIRSRTKDVVS